MSKNVEWIEHKGNRILVANFAGMKDEKPYVQAIADLEQEILRQPKGQYVPLIMDVRDTYVTKAVTDRGKQMMETAKARGIPDSPTVLVGLSGAQKAIVMAIQVVRKDVHVAGTIVEAKDWMAKRLK